MLRLICSCENGGTWLCTSVCAASLSTPVGSPSTARSIVPAAGFEVCLVIPAESEGIAVRHTVVTRRVLQPHGIVRGRRVEVLRVHVTAFGELPLVPPLAEYPLARFAVPGGGADAPHDLLDAGSIAQIHVEQLRGSSVREMAVRVDESGGGGPSVEVDTRVPDPRKRSTWSVVPTATISSWRMASALSDMVRGIHRQDRAVNQDEIGLRIRICPMAAHASSREAAISKRIVRMDSS